MREYSPQPQKPKHCNPASSIKIATRITQLAKLISENAELIEPRIWYVAPIALSRLLAEDEQQRAIAATVADIVWPACLRTADAVKKFSGSEEASETEFSLAHTPGKSMWETLTKNPEMGRNFGIFIGATGASEHLLNAVEWKGKVVDIGGLHEDVMIDVLNKYPEVTEAVMVNDFVLPEPNPLPPPLEKTIRSADMTMLALLNATERDEEGWHELFREADPPFKIT